MRTYKDLSESELCDLLKSGDYTAFSEIYERYSLQLMGHALKKCQDDDHAKDLLQEVFTNLWENRATLDIRKSLIGYLATSIRYSFFRTLKHEKVKDKYFASFMDFVNSIAPVTTTDHLIRRKQLEAKIDQEIQALPTKMREIFMKRHIEGLTHKQIAAELNISEKTVSRQVSYALARLRNRLPFLVLIYLINLTK